MTKRLCKCGCGNKVTKGRTWISGHNTNKAKDRFDWNDVEEDYEKLGSLQAVANEYGCTLQAVHYQLSKRGISTSREITNWDNLEEDYKRLKSVTKIAEEYGCSYRTVIDRLSRVQGFKFTHDNKSLDIEVGIGRYGERIALNILEDSKDMNDITTHYPYDIEWSDKNIDVKTSNKRKRPNGKIQYSFTARNQQCTHYLLIALDDENNPIKLLLVPENVVEGVTISFTYGTVSKWDKYELEVNEDELRKAVQNAKRIR